MIVLREGVMAGGGAVLALPLEVVVVGMGGNPSLLLVSSFAISRATARKLKSGFYVLARGWPLVVNF